MILNNSRLLLWDQTMSYLDVVTLPTDFNTEKEVADNRIVSQARARLCQHDYFRCRCKSIDIECREGRLVLMGRLPSFYLKQVLQTVLRGLPDVQRIDNRVDVVSSMELSSVKGERASGELSNG